MKARSARLTVRGIPPDVEEVLRERAKQSGLSINRVIVDVLIEAMPGEKRYADFSQLVGCWEPDEAFDEALAMQRQINPEDWI